MLTHAVRLKREVTDRRQIAGASERTDLPGELMRRLRVDQGAIYEFITGDVDFKPWAVHDTVEGFDDLAGEIAGGNQLFFQWDLDPAKDTSTYELEGLRELLESAREKCS